MAPSKLKVWNESVLTRLLDGKRINMYVVVVVVPEHVWRTVCSVCATGARVLRSPFHGT